MKEPQIVAYADEYPWMRCFCGWTLNWDLESPCPGCNAQKTNISYRDRFGHGTIKHYDGTTIKFKNVPYEDFNRMRF